MSVDTSAQTEFAHLQQLAEHWKNNVVVPANNLAAQLKAAREKPEDAVDAVLTGSDDPEVVRWREADRKIEEQIKAAQELRERNRSKAKEYALGLVPQNTEGFDADKAKNDFVALRAQSKTMRDALKGFLGGDDDAVKRLMDAFGIVEVVSLGRNATGERAVGATNIRRPRIASATVDGEVVEKDGRISFTLLVQELSKRFGKVDGDTVRKQAFAAAGTDDLSSLEAGTEVAFDLTIKGTQHRIVITTKGKPGSADDEDSEENSGEDDQPASDNGEG